MDLSHWVTSIVAFMRAGYPTGLPTTGYVPLAALSRRRVSKDEIRFVAEELVVDHLSPISTDEIGVAIMRVTNEVPSPDDVARVRRRLEEIGCVRGPRR
jgi:Protein of unknown function (DUF3349)